MRWANLGGAAGQAGFAPGVPAFVWLQDVVSVFPGRGFLRACVWWNGCRTTRSYSISV